MMDKCKENQKTPVVLLQSFIDAGNNNNEKTKQKKKTK